MVHHRFEDGSSIIKEFQNCLKEQTESWAGKGAYWLFQGKDRMVKLKSDLESLQRSVDSTLNLINISMVLNRRKSRSQDRAVKEETAHAQSIEGHTKLLWTKTRNAEQDPTVK
ncbi:hypothetical protein EK21DRAFT_86741 [Setomelanomma holmii]|uniref:Uncharacterized protein n=1 Tax=Setomelanomma holmii TaxID=210430 RepID=A0A9P4HG89_9PLEO|nr:hypothetical protein EK21DRAFT_86741 [Setomelanomma holmii]